MAFFNIWLFLHLAFFLTFCFFLTFGFFQRFLRSELLKKANGVYDIMYIVYCCIVFRSRFCIFVVLFFFTILFLKISMKNFFQNNSPGWLWTLSGARKKRISWTIIATEPKVIINKLLDKFFAKISLSLHIF